MLVVTKENRGKVEDFKADFGDQWNDDDKENKSFDITTEVDYVPPEDGLVEDDEIFEDDDSDSENEYDYLVDEFFTL